MQDFKSLAGERFSARKFTAEPVSKEDLEYIMECVRLAPSACNRQPWKWLIVRSEQAMKKLQECYDREWFKTLNIDLNYFRPLERWNNFSYSRIDK